MRCAQRGVGDCLTAPRRPAPRRVTERDQPCLIASYRTRPERRFGSPPSNVVRSDGGGQIASFCTHCSAWEAEVADGWAALCAVRIRAVSGSAGPGLTVVCWAPAGNRGDARLTLTSVDICDGDVVRRARGEA
jgi:hypothetical protein